MASPNTLPATLPPSAVLPVSFQINPDTHVATVGGVPLETIATTHGTPCYVMDGATVRKQCQDYKAALAAHYPNPGFPIYAGKAHLSMGMCQVVQQEDLYLDVVSAGELYTALKAGVAPHRLVFNGNNKAIDELVMALRLGVGRIVVDNFQELVTLAAIARDEGKTAQIYIRVVPGIECHTHDYIKTGHDDNKFGVPLIQLNQFLERLKPGGLYAPELQLMGLHAHIGSQIFEPQAYTDLGKILMGEYARIRTHYDGWTLPEIDCGGGLGIAYTEADDPISIDTYLQALTHGLTQACTAHDYPPPQLFIEPGRSLVATAGITLYRVGTLKQAPGSQRIFAAVDGGMGDNIRPALYQARYSAVVANRLAEPHDHEVRLVGKYCESGDVVLQAFNAPKDLDTGDVVAVFGTGAYNHAMAMPYNRIGRPPVIWVENGDMHVMVRRETLDDLVARDELPW
jgi:diaminopimelate decarboxylase